MNMKEISYELTIKKNGVNGYELKWGFETLEEAEKQVKEWKKLHQDCTYEVVEVVVTRKIVEI